jgi:hypothetical protein
MANPTSQRENGYHRLQGLSPSVLFANQCVILLVSVFCIFYGIFSASQCILKSPTTGYFIRKLLFTLFVTAPKHPNL